LARPQKSTTIKWIGDLNCYKIAEEINAKENGKAIVVETLNSLRNELNSVAKDNQVILILSNGTCLGLWESDFINELSYI